MRDKQEILNREKKILRAQILEDRNALSSEQKRLWNSRISEHLIKYDAEDPCAVYLCYANYKSEVSTKEFICRCLDKGKTVFVPKVLNAQNKQTEMEFYQITAWEELKEGYQGIPEPEALPERAFSEWLAKRKTEKIRIRMLLPGAVFDKKGNRIGYGGGFYDRWIAKWNDSSVCFEVKLAKIGLAYGMQIVEEIPAERFDQKVDDVITEDGKICVTGNCGPFPVQKIQ